MNKIFFIFLCRFFYPELIVNHTVIIGCVVGTVISWPFLAVIVGLKFDPWLGVIVLGAWLGLIVGTWLVQREYARNIRWRNAPWV